LQGPSVLEQSILLVKMGRCILWRQSNNPGGPIQSNIHRDDRLRGMPDLSAIQTHHGYLRRHDNPERREEWRDIQAKGRKLSSKWSFSDNFGRDLIMRWNFKQDWD